MHVAQSKYSVVVVIIVAGVKSPAPNKVPDTWKYLINKSYYYDWCQVCLLCLWREEWGRYLDQLLQAEVMNDYNEVQVCGLQATSANLLPNSSKIPITEHFLEYFTKLVSDLRDVFQRSDPVYNK